MKRRAFLKSCLLAPAAPIAVASAAPKSIDKYDNLEYGVWYKTQFSVFTVREIEMMCREWGWYHIESFRPWWINGVKTKNCYPPYFVCTRGVGHFLDKNKVNQWCSTTYRSSYEFPRNDEQYHELKLNLKHMAGDYYGKPWRDYYFYDIFLEPWDHTNGSAEWNKNREEVMCRMILSHIAIGKKDGKPWGDKETNI